MLVIQFIKFNKYVRNASFLSAVLLFMLSSLTILPLSIHTDHTEAATGTATSSTLSLDITNATASVDLTVASTNGTFASTVSGDEALFSVTTNNYTGYTLSISASDNSGTLVNGEDSLASISSSLTASQFDVSANNGKWGYKPSKYRSGNTTVDNTGNSAVYLTSPTTSGTTLDVTTTPNNNANSYTIALGARADYSKEAGTYTKTFTLAAVGNPINYSITYDKNTTDTVTNMPYSSNSNVQSGDTSSTTITLSNLVPVRDGYIFKGWCSTTTSDETCSGTTYNPDGGGTNLAFGIDQTTTNNTSLYAMWLHNRTVVGSCNNTKLCIQYEGNGLSVNNADANIVNYNSTVISTPMTKYSHTPNIGDDGTYSGSTYTSNMDTTDTVTIDGASSLNVTIYYDTESTSYDWVSVYQSPFDVSNANDATASNDTGNLSGKLAGRKSNRTTVYTTWYTQTYTITGDTVKFHFRSDRSSNYYGYYAVITGTGATLSRTVSSGEYATPTGTNAVFHGWSTTQTTAGGGLPSQIEYADESEVKSNMPGDEGESKTLYAVWQQSQSIIFTMDSNVSSIAVMNNDGTTAGTITASGQSLVLAQGNTYTIKPTHVTGYTTNAITIASGAGTLSGKQFTVGSGATTISITSRVMLPMQNYSCSNLANIGDTDMVYDVRDGEAYLIGKLADNKCWLLDNLRLDLVAHKNDLNQTNTNATNEQLAYLKGTSTGTSSDQWAMSGVSYWTSSNSYSAPLIAIKNASDESWNPNTTTTSYGNGSGKIGVYYNYCAVSAGTYCWGNGTDYTGSPSSDPKMDTGYDIDGDICPAGWRMPTGGAIATGTIAQGEYQNLYNQYSSATEGQAAAFWSALSTPLSGYFRDGSAYNQGSYGYFWSSTWSSISNLYGLVVYSSSVGPQNVNYRYYGYSVRCVLMPTVSYTLNYDKNTTDTVPNMPSSQSYGPVQDDRGHNFTLPTSAIPSRSGYTFMGWGTSNNQANPTYKYSNGSFTPSEATVSSSDNPETLYAIWQIPRQITFTMDGGVSSIQILDPDGNVVSTIASSGTAVTLMEPVTYTINVTHTTGYMTNAITKSLGSGTLNGKEFTVGSGSATINITSRQMLPMQNYSCSNLANIGDTDMVYDTRDGEAYLIGKLADGRCWLLDNLRLDLTNSTVLASLTTSNTNADANSLTSLRSGNRSAGAQYASSGFATWNSSSTSNKDNQAKANNEFKDTVVASYGAGSGKVGVYYNYCAASAGSYCYNFGSATGDANYDICPAGWRMPTGGSSGEYRNLYDTYSNASEGQEEALRNALSLLFSGSYTTGSSYSQNSEGYFLSSTNFGTIGSMSILFMNLSGIDPQSASGNSYGYSVRCIRR